MALSLYSTRLRQTSSPYGGRTGTIKFGEIIDDTAAHALTDTLTAETGYIQSLPTVALLGGADSFGRVNSNPGN